MCDDLSGDIVERVSDVDCLVNSKFFGRLELVYLSILLLHRIFICIRNVNHLADVQTCHKVLRQNERSTDNHIVNVLACQGHQHSFLDWNDWVRMSFVVLCHVIVPDTDIQKVTELLCFFQSF